MPIYEYLCKACNKEHSELRSFCEYDEMTATECEHCEAELTKKDRILGRGLKTTVNGTSKGNWNSNDWS